MQVSPSKVTDSTLQNANKYSNLTSNRELRTMSPYERKIGKVIALCPKCRGEGKIPASRTKKSKALRKAKDQHAPQNLLRPPEAKEKPKNEKDSTRNNSGELTHIPVSKRHCKMCDGSGLSTISLHDLGVDENQKGHLQNKPNTSINSRLPLAQIPSNFSVAIIGGGIGGIALAVALQHRGIPCVVYERDLSFEERKQGYGLTMQQGVRSLRALGFFLINTTDNQNDDSKTNRPAKKKREDNSEDFDKNPNASFGIHSKRHVVHKPDGSVVGEWGMRVWGGRHEKSGRGHATRQNAHISRQNLRKLLMEMLSPGSIKWGYKFIGYSRGGENLCFGGKMDSKLGNDHTSQENKITGLKLSFLRRNSTQSSGNRRTEQPLLEEVAANATILVGCDGIRSSVRSCKLGEDVTPLRYLDCIVILGITPSPNCTLTDGETVFQTSDGTTRLYAMPFAKSGEESAAVVGFPNGITTDTGKVSGSSRLTMWQLSFPMSESEAKKLSELGPSELKNEALKRCGAWHNPIPELLLTTPNELITGYPCYDRALVDKEVLRNGRDNSDSAGYFVTLLGDAAHPMSPFKGQGANQALLDAVLLARKLHSIFRADPRKNVSVDSVSQIPLQNSLLAAMGEFEAEMLQRSAVKVEKSAEAAKFLHTSVAISEGNVTRGAAAAAKVVS